MARAVALLLERDRAAVAEGAAVLALKDRRAALRLTSEVLDILAGHPAPAAGWDELPGWSAAQMAAAGLTWRRIPGWSIRRQPEPQAWAAGALVPDLLLQGDGARFLVCAVRSESHAARLAAIARGAESGDPLLFTGPAGALGPLYAAGALVVAQDAFDLDEIVRRAAELAAQRRAAPAAARRRLRRIA